MSLSGGGLLIGTPSAGGNFWFDITATDNNSLIATRTYTLSVSGPTISISPTSLPDATVGSAYTPLKISANGGTAPYFLDLSAIPPGMMFDTGTGMLAGTPTTSGIYSLSAKATDSSAGTGPYSAQTTVSINILPPTIVLSPATGTTLTAGQVGAPYNDTSISTTTGSGTINYSAENTADLPHGLSINSTTGAITGTPTHAGNYTFKVQATNTTGSTASADYTIEIAKVAPTVVLTSPNGNQADFGASVTFIATFAGGSSPTGTVEFFDGSISLGFGGISGPVVILSTSSLGVGTHVITAKYLGDANNASTTSAGITVTVASAKPTIIISASNSNPALGDSVTFTATLGGGSSPTGTVEFFDGSISLGTGTLSGSTATLSTSSLAIGSHTIKAVYQGDTSNASATSMDLTITVASAKPMVSLTSSISNPAFEETVTFTVTLGGGSSPSGTVEFFDGSISLGFGAISGPIATLSTSSLGVGTHVITAKYLGDANNASTTSTGLTITVTSAKPTITLSTFNNNPALGDSVTFTAILGGGSSPTGTVEFFDGSISLGTGTLSGTKATITTSALGVGTHTIGARYLGDTNNASTNLATITVMVTGTTATFVFTPSGGALSEAMVGESYRQPISATGGTGSLTYSIVSGALPKGMVLNISTGELNGPLDTDAEDKSYAFTIQVRDANGSTGTASYTLTVKPREVTVTDHMVNVQAGATPPNVYLNRGATGGPFVAAAMTFVEPSNAGTATIIQGELAASGTVTIPVGWYLQFTPNPAYSGRVQVGFRLTSALGISNNGTVTYNLVVDAAKTAAKIDMLVHGFVQSRQNMIANTIKVPGLLERQQMSEATDPVTSSMMPSEQGMMASFSTSLAQMESARDSADGVQGGYASPFNIWIDGAFLAHNDKDINGSKWGTFGMINTGADYLLTDTALVGLSFHYDRMTDPSDGDAELTGNGWMAGPYASFGIGKGVFWNAGLRYGGSSNDIDTAFWDGTFATTRWMADTSIEGQWMIGDDTSLSPKLRVLYFSETVDNYEVKNSAGDTIGIDGFNEEQFRVSLGAEIARLFTLESGAGLTPKLGVTGGFSGLDGAGAFGSVTAGLSLQTLDMWMLDASLLFNLDGDGGKSVGGRVRAGKTF